MATKFTFYDKDSNTYQELSAKELNQMFLSKDNINIGTMTGCFCPPHKGHLEAMKSFVKDLHIDVLIISSVNSDKRFGARHYIPLDFTDHILKQYAKFIGCSVLITSIKDNYVPEFYKKLKGKMFNMRAMEDLTLEQFVELNEKDGFTKFEDHDNIYIKNMYGRVGPGLRRNFNEDQLFDVRYLREEDGSSATKTARCIGDVASQIKEASECFQYLPDEYSEEEKNDYINTVTREYYTPIALEECLEQDPRDSGCAKLIFNKEIRGDKAKEQEYIASLTTSKRRRLEGGKKGNKSKTKKTKSRRKEKRTVRKALNKRKTNKRK